MTTRSITVRARVAPRPEPPLERLHDPLLEDLARGGPLSRERFAVRWGDAGAVRALAEAKRAPLPAELVRTLDAEHRRLGASEASLASLGRLARGEAVCTVAGQQPGPLGGPLYSLHKIASAVGLAAVVEERTGIPCVPLFWMHGEDSDFEEIRGVTLADAALTLRELALPASAHHDGALVGSIPTAPLRDLEAQALECWAGLAGREHAAALMTRSQAHAADLGEAFSALMLAWFANQGLVVVDPRRAAFRAAARPILERYLASADELGARARRAGASLARTLGRTPLSEASLESFVFAVEDGVRHKISVAEARMRPAERPLSPSVALRPVVQDGVLPTVAMACGPGEAAYLAQLREVFEGLGVRPACPVPRLSMTWLPPPAIRLLEASGAPPAELVVGTDAVLRRLAEAQVPAGVRETLERARAEAMEGLARFGAAAQEVDASLPQLVESARGKVDYQYARLLEGMAGKLRHRLERQHPEWLRLRYYLMPGERTQERRLASLEVAAYRGPGLAEELCELAGEQARRVATGILEHLLVDL